MIPARFLKNNAQPEAPSTSAGVPEPSMPSELTESAPAPTWKPSYLSNKPMTGYQIFGPQFGSLVNFTLRQTRRSSLRQTPFNVMNTKLASAMSTASTSSSGSSFIVTATVTEEGIKQNNVMLSLVSVSFSSVPGSDFGGARVWVKGYKGNTNNVLMAAGSGSPIEILFESTGETITVTVQGYNSTETQYDTLATCPTASITLNGITTAPPSPTISQTLIATPLGVQFEFNQLGGAVANVIAAYRVFKNSTNNSGTATLFKTIAADPTETGPVVVEDNVGGGKTNYYWVAAVDIAGNVSALVSAQSGAIVSGTASLDSDVSDGTVYARSRSGVLLAGIPFSNSFGKNLVSNPGFESNACNATGGYQTALGTVMCDNWQIALNDNGVFDFSRENSAGSAHSGNWYLTIGCGPGQIIPTGSSSSNLVSTHISCLGGEQFFLSGYIDASNGFPTGSWARTTGVYVNFYDSTGAYLSNFNTNLISTTPSGYQYMSASGTVPTGAASLQVICVVIVTNSTGSSFTVPANTFYFFCRFDDISLVLLNNLDTEITDGSTYSRTYKNFNQYVTASGTIPTSTFLTGQGSILGFSDNSAFGYLAATTSIYIASNALTIYMQNGTSYSALANGNVTGLEGGNVTDAAWSFTGLTTASYHFGGYYQISDSSIHVVISDVNGGKSPGSQQWVAQTLNADGRIALFSDWIITTPASGTSGGSGSTGGGGGGKGIY